MSCRSTRCRPLSHSARGGHFTEWNFLNFPFFGLPGACVTIGSKLLFREDAMELQGKRIAVLAADLYQEMEVWYPLLRFREDGAETVAVGAEEGKTYSRRKATRSSPICRLPTPSPRISTRS